MSHSAKDYLNSVVMAYTNTSYHQRANRVRTVRPGKAVLEAREVLWS